MAVAAVSAVAFGIKDLTKHTLAIPFFSLPYINFFSLFLCISCTFAQSSGQLHQEIRERCLRIIP